MGLSLVISSRPALYERRDGIERRTPARGGRRVEDLGGIVSVEPCDGCGSRALERVATGHGYHEHRCRRCRYRVFISQSLH